MSTLEQLNRMLHAQSQFNQWQKVDSIQRVRSMSVEEKLIQYASLLSFVWDVQNPAVQSKKFQQKIRDWQAMNTVRQTIAEKLE